MHKPPGQNALGVRNERGTEKHQFFATFLPFHKEGRCQEISPDLTIIYASPKDQLQCLPSPACVQKEWGVERIAHTCVCGWCWANKTIQGNTGPGARRQRRKAESLSPKNDWMHWSKSQCNCSTIYLILCVNTLVTLAGYHCVLSWPVPLWVRTTLS